MRAAGDRHRRRSVRLQENRNHRLRDERDASGRADVEAVVSRPDLPGRELQRERSDFIALHLRPADFCDSPNARQMLALEPRLVASGANLRECQLVPSDRRKRQRGAQHLPAALAHRSVYSNQFFHCALCLAHPVPTPVKDAPLPTSRNQRAERIIQYSRL